MPQRLLYVRELSEECNKWCIDHIGKLLTYETLGISHWLGRREFLPLYGSLTIKATGIQITAKLYIIREGMPLGHGALLLLSNSGTIRAIFSIVSSAAAY